MIFDELWRLERQLGVRQRARSRTLKRLRQEPGSGGIAILSAREKPAWQEAGWEIDALRDEIERSNASRLIRRANRLGLPTPAFNVKESIDGETWERGITGSYHLTRTAQADLRSRIRLEKKERREALAFWVKDILVPVLSVALGIIGATTGLIAVLHR